MFGPRLIVSHDDMFWGMWRGFQLYSALPNRVQDPESILTVTREAIDREVELSFPISQAVIRLATIRSIRQQLHDQKTRSSLSPAPIAELLQRMRKFAVTDQRDRVHAVLGMTQHQDRSTLEVNYSEPIQLLSCRVSNLLAEAGSVLELLYCLASLDSKHLSSWMINLESGRDRDNIEIQGTAERQTFQPKAFHASRGRQFSYKFDKQSQVLAVAGCIVDEIVGASREYPNLRDSQNPTWPLEDALSLILNRVSEASQMASEHIQRLTRDDYSRVLWTTLVAEGRLAYGDTGGFPSLISNLATAIAAREQVAKGPDASWAGTPSSWTDELIAAMTRDYQREMEHVCRLCVTQNDRLGLVHAHACQGDGILIVLGGPLPLVARKTTNAYPPRGPNWHPKLASIVLGAK
jgi:hypothetical protein